ncbi:hypothetical protein EVJ58_g4708 [Rhodofomes roseus]|uniref:Uncharacterized protein n=1 Tax=Rhodofomes roseus TaxID=34475 RepID=A0A4Y9YGI7_9APHY|nr:hypothetical protein EVJ58_g4708 [Rhodofomes roseus]
MRWLAQPVLLTGILAIAGILANASQTYLSSQADNRPGIIKGKRLWNEKLGKYASSNLVFQSLASLMQLKPNSKYPNGHSIVRAGIPAGTLLYHGSMTTNYRSRDWMAFDPEHAFIFALGSNGTLFTFTTTRELHFIYFDGCSANKDGGVVDTQDIFFWGDLRRTGNSILDEIARINDGCEWAKSHGIDGFIRMEWDFEIMYCDFSQGVEVVSAVRTNNGVPDQHQFHDLVLPVTTPTTEQLSGQRSSRALYHGLWRDDFLMSKPPRNPVNRTTLIPPKGWKGTLPFTFLESRHAGAWHNDFPGELRVRVYPSTIISFFDPALTSLVDARRSQKREDYRAGNISEPDIARVRADIAEMMSRDWSPGARGDVDWVGLAHVVQDRFAYRLPYMHYLLHSPATNVSERLEVVRKQLVASLIPYMPRHDHIGTNVWFADTARGCAESFTKALPVERLTKQEILLKNAVDEVLHEICRVYTEAWADAFDAEGKSEDVLTGFMHEWSGQFDELMEWLDWPVWTKCDPACGPDEYCLLPQLKWWWWFGAEPTCVSMDDETYSPQSV